MLPYWQPTCEQRGSRRRTYRSAGYGQGHGHGQANRFKRFRIVQISHKWKKCEDSKDQNCYQKTAQKYCIAMFGHLCQKRRKSKVLLSCLLNQMTFSSAYRKQDHLRVNVAPDQTIIFGQQIFLDHRSSSSIDQKILMTPFVCLSLL